MQEKYFNNTASQLNILLNSLLILEEDPENFQLVEELMRITHSLKGSSRLMDFKLIEHLFHAMEDKFSSYRNETAATLSAFIDDLLLQGRKIEYILEKLQMGFSEEDIQKRLEEKLKGNSEFQFETREPHPADVSRVMVGINKLDALNKMIGELTIKQVSLEHYVTELEKLEMETVVSNELLRSSLSDFLNREEDQGPLILAVDNLLDIVHTCDNSLKILSESKKKIWRSLKLIPTEMKELLSLAQKNILHSRLTPVSHAFEMIPRLVRELCRTQGKKVKLTIDGGETLLDKYILDGISTSLIHLIRNAVDHGIEHPERRTAEGKSDSGRIYIQAVSRGEKVVIRVEDDGQGIDEEKLKQRLLERGLLSEAELRHLKQSELYHYLLRQGISTRDEISEISGRGVGMDVVRTTLERLKGSIRIQSARGVGTIIELDVPLTLSLMQAVPVVVKGETYCIPIFNLEKVVQVRFGELQNREPFYHYDKEEAVPIASLGWIVGNARHSQVDEDTQMTLVYLRSVEKRWALLVDEAHHKKEIVVKECGTFLKRVKHILGATITGEGRVALILDVPSIIKTLEMKEQDRGRSKH
jgi:two-component system, chemotaxis family, sensor kinase CheA